MMLALAAAAFNAVITSSKATAREAARRSSGMPLKT
jgi:hypothetical protein